MKTITAVKDYNFRFDKYFYKSLNDFYISRNNGKTSACWTVNCKGNICYAYHNRDRIAKIFNINNLIKDEKTIFISKTTLLREINIELRNQKIKKITNEKRNSNLL